MEKELLKDKKLGMPLEDALKIYGNELGEEFIERVYAKDKKRDKMHQELISALLEVSEKIDTLPK